MAATKSSVTLLGYGNGTFVGSVNLIPTLGYGIGVAVVVDYVTTRLSLLGISQQRVDILGTSQQRSVIMGASNP